MSEEANPIEEIKVGYEDLVKNLQSNETNSEVNYYGRWEGVVIDNEDPEKLGRVKIRIFGFYDDIEENNIPWAHPDVMFIGGLCGNFVVPKNDTILRGYFDQGDVQKPFYDSIAFSEKNITDAQADAQEDYPHKMILFQTDEGDTCTLNRNTGEFAFIHRTGASIIMKENGELQIDAGTDGETGQGSDLIITVHGNVAANIDGECDIHTQKGNIKIDSDLGMVMLGRNAAKQFLNNLPTCLVTGAPHFIGVTNVQV